jgi:hypothetical protein
VITTLVVIKVVSLLKDLDLSRMVWLFYDMLLYKRERDLMVACVYSSLSVLMSCFFLCYFGFSESFVCTYMTATLVSVSDIRCREWIMINAMKSWPST